MLKKYESKLWNISVGIERLNVILSMHESWRFQEEVSKVINKFRESKNYLAICEEIL